MDIIANRKRPIRPDDVVHESVSCREQALRRFEANNPSRGLSVVNDSGEILPASFNQ